jgi:RNA polymerase sigma-70 factor (ECF subfamily)
MRTRETSKYEEFSNHLEEHYSPLFGYILSLVHSPDDAEDIFQQTALTLWRKYDEFRPDGSFRAWAAGVARHHALTFLRTKRRDRHRFGDAVMDLLHQWQIQAPPGEQTRRQAALRFCVQKLSELQRQMLDRYYVGRETAREIGESLGRTAQSVHSSLNHIRRQLHDCMMWRLGERPVGDEEHPA